MNRRMVLLVGCASVTACTPTQLEQWKEWYSTDPVAAVEFANRPEIQEQLIQQPSSTPDVGDCDSYASLFAEYGLPVDTFKRIAWRESGCNHTSFVRDHDDLGGGLLGINLRAGADTWSDWCGLTIDNVTDARTNIHCAAEAYERMGMEPWQ